MSKVYLAVWYDRHVCDTYRAFQKLDDAKQWVQDQADDYGSEYEFGEPGWDWQENYVHYLSSNSDEGPHGFVKVVDLVENPLLILTLPTT